MARLAGVECPECELPAPLCQGCGLCTFCCDCDDLFDADELGLDPEDDDARRYRGCCDG